MPGQQVTQISWNWGDGPTEVGWFPKSHTYSQAGTYTITVTAMYDDGDIASASTDVTVSNGQDSSSTASATSNPSELGTNTANIISLGFPSTNGPDVTLNGCAMPGGEVSYISWSWGDNSQTTGWFPQSHTYTQTGTYTITVTANYNDGTAASASTTVAVSDGSTSSSQGVSSETVTFNQNTQTGVVVTISSPTLAVCSNLNVVTMNFGTNPPSGIAVTLGDSVFYDIYVDGTIGPDVPVQVQLTGPSITDTSVIQYWNGQAWTPVATTFIEPNSAVGMVPVYAFSGTVFGVTADSAAPTGAITYPINGATLTSGTFTITGTAADTGGSNLAKVEVKVDDSPHKLATGTTTWSLNVDGLTDGTHTITAKITDNAGNTFITPATTIRIQTPLYTVTFTETGLPPKTSWSITLNGITQQSATSMIMFAVKAGSYTWKTTTPISGGPGTQYTTSPTQGTLQVTNKKTTVNIVYVTQYKLTIASNYGTTNPQIGTEWYNKGSKMTIQATPPTPGNNEQYVWQGWKGEGSGSYTGTDNPRQITISAPITETANWRHQYKLTVQVGGSLLPATLRTEIKVDGKDIGEASPSKPVRSWIDAGSTVKVTALNQVTVGRDKFNLVSWTGTAYLGNTATLTMDTAKTLTANYQKAL
jgi:hypothetical protein